MIRSSLAFATFLLGGVAFGACAELRLEVPPDLAGHRLEVSHHGRELAFGEFTIKAGPPRSHISKTIWGGIMTEEKIEERHVFGFALVAEGALQDEVACERSSVEASHDVGLGEDVRSQHDLDCVLSAPDGHYRGEVKMSAKKSVHHLKGDMVRSQVAIDLVPSKHAPQADTRTGDAFAPAGYEIRIGGVQIGAVQTRDHEAVWIDPRVPFWLRKQVALAAAVLLIHSEIYQSVDAVAATGFGH